MRFEFIGDDERVIGGFLAPLMRAFGPNPGHPHVGQWATSGGAISSDANGQHRLHAMHVLSLVSHGVSRAIAYQDIDPLRRFDLPHVLPAEAIRPQGKLP